MRITPAEILLVAWLGGALIASVPLTVYAAKNPYEPAHNEVSWKVVVVSWSLVWPLTLLVAAFFGLRRFRSPWVALYEKIQKTS